MENVHKTESRPWISSKVNVRKFRDDWFTSLTRPKSDTATKFNMTAKEYSKLEEECGLSAMKCPYQDFVEIGKSCHLPEDFDLETLKLQAEDLQKRNNDPQYKAITYCHSRYFNYPPYKGTGITAGVSDGFSHQPVANPDVVLFVQIYKPEKKCNVFHKAAQSSTPYFNVDQELMVLGSQYLTELRDKIVCVSDKAIPGEFSDMPELIPTVNCKDLYKSGFFCIDGVFYNDMRNADCRDYSQVIIDWAKNPARGIGPFKKAFMEKSKFIDLEIQLGYPYVYVHQGECEHLIVFTDLQFFSHHHPSNRLEYPLPCALRSKKRVLCMICRIHTSEWIVFDNVRIPENPVYFCKQCFFSFNYDENNQKIGNFKAYHHVDRCDIL